MAPCGKQQMLDFDDDDDGRICYCGNPSSYRQIHALEIPHSVLYCVLNNETE